MLVTKGRAAEAIIYALGGVAQGGGVFEVSSAAGAIIVALGGQRQESGDTNYELREDGGLELREDGGYELRE